MEELIVVLRIILDHFWDILVGGSAEIVDLLTLHQMALGADEEDYEFYFRGLRNLLTAVALMAMFVILLGMVVYIPWVISLAGIALGLVTVFLTIAGAPLALLIAGLGAAVKTVLSRKNFEVRIGKYINFMRNVLLVEAVTSLFLSVFPVKNNPQMLLVAIVAAVVLGLLEGAGNRGKKFVSLLATVVIVVSIIAFSFPKTFASMQGWREKIDNSIAPDVSVSSGNSLIPPGGTLETPEERAEFNASLPKTDPSAIAKASEKKDLISFPQKLTKGVWSTETDLFSLIPFRYHWDVFVSDSVRIRFSNRTELVVHPGDTLRVGNHPAVMSFLAFNDSTTVVPIAWNQ